MQYITIIDFLLLPVYLYIFYIIIKRKSIQFTEADMRKYFITAFYLRMAGAVAYSFLVQYYYGYGDSFTFYEGSNFFMEQLGNDLGNIQYFFASPAETQAWFKSISDDSNLVGYIGIGSSLMVMKIATFFSVLSFNKFLIIALFFGLFSFAGQWKLFLVFNDILKSRNRKILAYLVLYTPSLWFWGSGILKDSICLGATGFVISILYTFFAKKKVSISNILLLAFMIFILSSIKSYISFILFFSILIMLGFIFLNSIKNIILKIGFFLFSILILLLILISFDFTEQIKAIAEETAQQVNSYKTNYENMQEQEENSKAGYDAGEVAPSIGGIILQSPRLIFTTLFRPFIWESRKIIMLFSALESLFLFLCTLYLFYKTRVVGFFRIVFSNRYAFLCFTISLLFALLIGLTTFNFGTMSRYKIILMPFYYFMLVYVYTQVMIKEATNNNTAPA
jgi:hypothetical protein